MFSYNLDKKQEDSIKAELSNIHVTYTTRIKNAMDTFQMQLNQLDLLQKI